MANWKTKVNPVYIQNHDVHNDILVYNTKTGESIIGHRIDFPELKDTWRGFYKEHFGDLLGIFASTEGPIFFVNSTMYQLNGADWQFIVDENSSTNVFSFIYNKELVYTTEYNKVIDLGIHPYADEEFMDFFSWLKGCKERKSFFKFYNV